MTTRAEHAIAVVRSRSRGAALPGAARIALHFHPDRDVRGMPVLERILDDGAYRSQFATSTSNGALGGDRARWEHRMFDGAYDAADADERPVYGALDLDHDPYGPAPRFGSALLRLRSEVMSRATFCYPDSTFAPIAFGVSDRAGLVAVLRTGPQDDPLDRYVEAQVHGTVGLDDVEAVVLDPDYARTDLAGRAMHAGVSVEWHPGYRLTVDELRRHREYRGEEVVALGERLAVGGILTPRLLGAVRGAARIDARRLKQLWHCVARFGRVR